MIFLKNESYKKVYGKRFAGRAVVCYFLMLFMLLSCVLRIMIIMSGNYSSVAASQDSYRIKVRRERGTIYDCNMLPLTNNKKSVLAVVCPTPRAVLAASALLDGEQKENLINNLKNNKPSVCILPRFIECDGIACTYIYETEGGFDACHITGYLNSDGHGATGLEAAYDDLLYSDDFISAVVGINGKGEILYGTEPKFEKKTSSISNAVVSTIDINLQNAVYKVSKNIKKGAVVIAEAKTGKIRVLLSFPQYDTANISDYLSDQDSPFLNRALLSYSVGSIFKPCVAAAGIESGNTDFIFDCKGSTFIIDRDFKCHKAEGHGTVDLRQAIAYSCNCFFYNYAMSIGGECIYKMARTLNFGASIKIAGNIKTKQGSLPSVDTLKNPAQLSNFSIGQGEFSASPVSMLPLYMAIANGGKYYLPSLVEKTVNESKTENYDIGYPTIAMSEDTANILKEYLCSVISEGTGISAVPETVSAAGKTATAQTGKTDEQGVKLNNSWFCGFFPADEPQYVAVILSEGGNSAGTNKVFADIADTVTQMMSERS